MTKQKVLSNNLFLPHGVPILFYPASLASSPAPVGAEIEYDRDSALIPPCTSLSAPTGAGTGQTM